MRVVNKSITFWSMFLFTTISILLWYNANVYAEDDGIHLHDFNERRNCDRCHLSQSIELKFDPITVCVRCHPSNLGDHIINIVPTNAIVPDGLPLTNDGKITCYSCHDYHNKTGIAMMLWVDYSDLCVMCHVGY